MSYLKHWLVGDQLPIHAVGFIQQRANSLHHLLALLVVLDSVDGAARTRRQRIVELGVFAESTGVAQEWILLIVVYSTRRTEYCILCFNYRYKLIVYEKYLFSFH